MSEEQSILILEEDGHYACILELAFRQAGLTGLVHVASGREEALEYLEGIRRNHDRQAMPSIILISLPMPLLQDFEVLRWIRARPEYNSVYVAVLSGIEYAGERRKARELGADCYQVKPFMFGELVEFAGRVLGAKESVTGEIVSGLQS
ncbi:MAG TPA: response regulator [Clostridia bacterium]|nr:response regulator [Clostridia bacterium]